MSWIATFTRRILGRFSSESPGQHNGGEPERQLDLERSVASSGHPSAPGETNQREAPGLDEWISAFDLDQEKVSLAEEKARLAEQNARLWTELMARNARLERAREENEKSVRAQTAAEQSLREALDREMEIVAALLPNVEFLRDSREVVRSGLKSRLSALAVLRELSVRPGQMRGTRVQGAEGWLEQHFKTGDGVNGRIYYRSRAERCSILVSFKADQVADIRYLQGQ